jgi:D-3-phosphoglycerate dehydrogenase
VKVLIIDDVDDLLITGLEKIGHDVTYLPSIKRTEIIEKIAPYEILVVRTKTQIDQEIFAAAPNLKIIARAGSGLDNIDLAIAEQRNITCINAGEANADAVGEFTLGALLNLFRNINIANFEVRNKIWDREGNRGKELNGKTVGIIGFGNTGKAFAKKLAGFDVKVLAYEIYLLNMCRGEVVNMPETIEYINNNIILGAAFDVLENEKLTTLSNQQQKDFDYLINNKKIVLSPHIAGWTFESYVKIAQNILLKLTNLK